MGDTPPLDYEAKAAELWTAFDPNERAGVAFGLFPADEMALAEREGYETHPLVVALMRLANSRKGNQS